jgi:N-terminal 7TM region of histidine kinase
VSAVVAVVAVVACRRRFTVAARELALLMLAIAWWLVASALEASASERPTKIAWAVDRGRSEGPCPDGCEEP